MTATAHRATWWVYAGRDRIRHTAQMRGTWDYDVTCSCGWDSATGGALRRYVAEKLDGHRREAAAPGPTVDDLRRALTADPAAYLRDYAGGTR